MEWLIILGVLALIGGKKSPPASAAPPHPVPSSSPPYAPVPVPTTPFNPVQPSNPPYAPVPASDGVTSASYRPNAATTPPSTSDTLVNPQTFAPAPPERAPRFQLDAPDAPSGNLLRDIGVSQVPIIPVGHTAVDDKGRLVVWTGSAWVQK